MADARLLAELGALLDEVLELGAGERGVRLAALRRERPMLAAELDRMLAGEARLAERGFLEPGAAAPLAAELPPLTGTRIGVYRLLRPLGRGGMGTVWLAERADGRFDATYAVKLLNLALLDPVGLERFRREGQLLARLTHPNIARLVDAGVTDTGVPYLVLEHVDGVQIDRYCDGARLPPVRRIQLFQQVLAAVAHAHGNLIVHRDLKPSNVLVTTEGAVKLLDFGIARLIEEEGGGSATTLTGSGGHALTPEFAAPEQVSGGAVTTATDVYALGVLLYVLLSGRHPTAEEGQSAAGHLRDLAEAEPVRLSAAVTDAAARGATADRLRRHYAGDLDNILARALKKAPQERYPTVTAFGDDLRRFLAHEPVAARPDSLGYRAGKFLRRHRVPAVAAALGVLALAGVALRERELRARAESEARKALAVEEFLISVFDAADPFAPPTANPGEVTVRSLLDRGIERIDTAMADQPDVRADLRAALGRVYSDLGLFAQAETQVRRVLSERLARFGPRRAEVAAAMDQLGGILSQVGKHAEADSLLRAALALRRQGLGNRHDATAESLDHLAELRRQENDFAAAESLLREALDIRAGLHGPHHLSVAQTKNNLALILWSKGDYANAEALYREALAIRVDRLGENHPLTAQTVQNLAQARQQQGHLAEAESLYRRSLDIKRKALGDAHPSTTISMSNLGQLLLQHTPKKAEAESLLRGALALDRQIFGEQHPFVAQDLAQLATVAMRKGDFDEAERLGRQSLAISRALHSGEHFNIAFALNNLAAVLRLKGASAQAVPLLREAVTQYDALVGADHRNTLVVAGNLARALREIGETAEAERIFRASFAGLARKQPQDTSLVDGIRVGLGRTLIDVGRPGEALPLLETAFTGLGGRHGPGDLRTTEAALALGEALLALRQYERAGPLVRDAAGRLEAQRETQPVLAAHARGVLRRLERAAGG